METDDIFYRLLGDEHTISMRIKASDTTLTLTEVLMAALERIAERLEALESKPTIQ